MKNLKRVLSLALATVMLLGMMVVGANAAFNDQDSINYKEAVNTLVGLGVVDGMGENQFQPTGTLTRAQGAKLVAMVKAGSNETTIGYYAGSTKFKDVPKGHWAEGAINYCVANGIIAGTSETTFNPDGKLTGAALAKMMLIALGYPSTSKVATETLLGPAWQLNAIRKATELGLFDKLNSSFSATKDITREEACKVMFNALGVEVMKVTGYNADGPIYGKGETPEKLLAVSYKAKTTTGVVKSNGAIAKANANVTVITVDGTDRTFNTKTGLELIGHKVDVYTTGTSANAWDNKVIAVTDKATKVATVKTESNGTISVKSLKEAGFAGAAVEASATHTKNYSADANNMGAKVNVILISNGAADEKGLFPIASMNVTTDDIYDVVTNAYKTLNKDGEVASATGVPADAIGIENVSSDAKNPSVVVKTTIGTAVSLEVCTPVKATIEKLVGTNFVAGGTTYSPLKAGLSMPAGANLGKEMTIYVNAAGAAVHVVGAAAPATAYAYVAQFGKKVLSEGTALADPKPVLVADVYFADGTHSVYPVNVDATTGKTFAGATYTSGTATSAGGLGVYAYTVNDKGQITLETPALPTGVTSAAVTGITKGLNKVNATVAVSDSSATSLYANDKTLLFYVNGTYGQANYTVEVKTGIANAVTTVSGGGVTIAPVVTLDGTTKVLAAAAIGGQVTSVGTKDVFYFANGEGDCIKTQTAEGYTLTYSVYDKTGAKVTREYTSKTDISKFADVKGFVTDNADGTNLAAASVPGMTFVGSDNTGVAVDEFYNGTLTVTVSSAEKMIMTGSAPIVDLTGHFDGKLTTANTKIAVAYSTENGTNNAVMIVVVSQ